MGRAVPKICGVGGERNVAEKIDFGTMVEVIIPSNSGLFWVINVNKKKFKYPDVICNNHCFVFVVLCRIVGFPRLLYLLLQRSFYEKDPKNIPWYHSPQKCMGGVGEKIIILEGVGEIFHSFPQDLKWGSSYPFVFLSAQIQ